MKALLVYKKRERGSVTQIANKLGNPSTGPNEWLILTPKDKMPKPEVVSFPKPPKAPDGSLMYERIPNKDSPVTVAGAPAAVTTVAGAAGAVAGGAVATAASLDKGGPVPMNVSTSSSLKRRHNDDVNGLDSECGVGQLLEGVFNKQLFNFPRLSRTADKTAKQGPRAVTPTHTRAVPSDDGGCPGRRTAVAQTSCNINIRDQVPLIPFANLETLFIVERKTKNCANVSHEFGSEAGHQLDGCAR